MQAPLNEQRFRQGKNVLHPGRSQRGVSAGCIHPVEVVQVPDNDAPWAPIIDSCNSRWRTQGRARTLLVENITL